MCVCVCVCVYVCVCVCIYIYIYIYVCVCVCVCVCVDVGIKKFETLEIVWHFCRILFFFIFVREQTTKVYWKKKTCFDFSGECLI